ncbi:MAG TPA: lysylphosphatidylglycerol synthase transmembrane domain-containing protein [Myxococcaceae bacterium]|nr:lysylphosphatidylglycerol synthase transmembrane domain-containing protein [Myxococcaceae bacterium]
MRRWLRLAASLAVTLVCGAWAFRDTHWAEQWASLRAAHYLWLLPYFVILGTIHVCRTLRWGCLLSGLERVPFRPLNDASAIGFMYLLVLPFRMGEFARPFLIAERSSIRRSAAMTTVVLERITDGVFVALLLRALLFFVPEDVPDVAYVRFGANAMFGIFFGGLLFLLFAAWHHDRAVALVRGAVGWASPRLAERVADIVDAFVGALRQLPGPLGMVAFFAWTLVYWGVNGFGMWLVARKAFDLPLDLFQSYVVLCVLVVGLMIPAAPGMIGTFQAAIRVGLALFLPGELVRGSGLAFANVLWLCQTGQQIAFGLFFLSVDKLSFTEVAGKLEAEEKGRGAQAG